MIINDKTMKLIKHTIETENLKELKSFIATNKLNVKTDIEYDYDETNEVLLIGSLKDIKTITAAY